MSKMAMLCTFYLMFNIRFRETNILTRGLLRKRHKPIISGGSVDQPKITNFWRSAERSTLRNEPSKRLSRRSLNRPSSTIFTRNLAGLKHVAIMLVACTLLSACGTKMAYGYLDWAIQWKIRGLVPLTSEQKQQTKLASVAFHQWHQSTQLSQYADYLESLKALLEKGPVTEKIIHAETDKVQLLLDQSLRFALPSILQLSQSLTDKQVDELLESFKEDREEYRNENVDISEDKKYQNRYKELRSHIKPWFGRLDKKQRELIHLWSRSLKPYETYNVKIKANWEEDLRLALEKREDLAELEKSIKPLLSTETDSWEPEIEAVFDYNQHLTLELLAELVNNLSDKQKEHMFDKFDDYIKICRDLARK